MNRLIAFWLGTAIGFLCGLIGAASDYPVISEVESKDSAHIQACKECARTMPANAPCVVICNE